MTLTDRLYYVSTIARKELRMLLVTPIAYITAIVFLGVSEFMFFRNLFAVGEASLAGYTAFLPWILMLVVPALTMGVFANEEESGTYETLSVRPYTEWEITIGKFAAIKIALALLLALAYIPLAIGLSFFGDLDVGATVGGYLAGVALASLFAALGVFLSTLFSRQVTALLTSIVAAFFFIVAGLDLIAQSAPLSLALLLERLSALSHFTSLSRGVIDLRDV